MGLGNWLRNHPHGLERIYSGTEWLFNRLDPFVRRIGYDRADSWFRFPEQLAKEIIFDCRMCGQCILHSTGMTCPMTCPKELRNGPCGGVREDGSCEVDQIGQCIWVNAYERSLKMHHYGDSIIFIQPPVNRQLQGSSAWITMLSQEDSQSPSGWVYFPKISVSSEANR